MRDSHEIRVHVFAFSRFTNMSHLFRGTCLLKKRPTNEITEPLGFTVCKVELRGKRDSVTIKFSGQTFLGRWSKIIVKTEGK